MTKVQLTISIRNKFWSLGILAFSSGAIIMALEIVSSRIITPVFGSSTYTWGSLIGVILAGLSLGYFLGGKIADKNPNIKKICSVVFSVGLYIIFIPFISPSIIEFSVTVFLYTQYAPLMATFILLIFPSVLLGFVSPYVIKLGSNTLKKIGKVSGNLYSISGMGSIFGTLFTVFVLIPNFEVRQIIFGLGITLMISSLIGLKITSKILTVVVIIILLTPVSSVAVGIIPHAGNTIYEKETPYSHLDVIDFENIRILYLDGMPHSAMNKVDPKELVIDYTEFFHLGKILNPELEKVLFVGGGGFSGPTNFLLMYPDIEVDVVELDADVIDVAKNFFELKEVQRLKIYNEDARRFLTDTQEKYDLIILDAYATSYVPFHLITDEFYKIVETKLQPRGIVISNLLGSLVGDTSDLFRAIYKTQSDTFPNLYIFTTEHKISNTQNLMLVAMKEEKQFDRNYLLKMATENSIYYLIDDFSEEGHVYNEKIKIDDVPFLTDEFSSVEKLLNPITIKPYEKETLEYSKTESNIFSQSGAITYGLLFSVVLVWSIEIRRMWKTV